MPFQRVQSEKLSQTVVHQVELLILRGILRPGERLPSERELSERLGVSRPSLRDAVAELQKRGLLHTRAGAGIYVSEALCSTFSPALVDLFASHDEALFDYIAFRRDLEAMAAERAARFGSETDLKVIDTLFSRMVDAHERRDATDEATLDAEFHLSIVEASHNVIMLHTMRAMFDLLRRGVFYNRQMMFRQRTTRSGLLDQHRAINDALQSRDPAASRAAVEAHLTFVEATLHDFKRSQKHEEIAQLRFEHAQER